MVFELWIDSILGLDKFTIESLADDAKDAILLNVAAVLHIRHLESQLLSWKVHAVNQEYWYCCKILLHYN